MTPAELAASAPSSRAATLASVRSSGDPTIDRKVFDKSMEEVNCGWLSGPVPLNELQEDAIISRRFGIKQSSGDKVKIRLIDDFSLSGVNSTVQVETAPKLHTLDVVGALCLELLKGQRAEPWSGKTFDLSSAYRQLGVHPESKWASYIALYDPSTKKPMVFAMKPLPFGASRSVLGSSGSHAASGGWGLLRSACLGAISSMTLLSSVVLRKFKPRRLSSVNFSSCLDGPHQVVTKTSLFQTPSRLLGLR